MYCKYVWAADDGLGLGGRGKEEEREEVLKGSESLVGE